MIRRGRKISESEAKKIRILFLVALLLGVVSGTIGIFVYKNLLISLLISFGVFIFVISFYFARKALMQTAKIRKMEDVFPDFLQLMSSNLRAGMTTDRALLMSSRKEFAPLDKEILQLGKDILTGKQIEDALINMSKRVGSRKIDKIITLIVSGIKSGGNLAILLEETSRNMRERDFVEKKAASNVLMYVIFIFFASAIGAPTLFGLSSILVGVLTDVLSSIPVVENTSVNLPFTLTSISVSVEFIKYFSIVFIIVIDILGSLVIGLVSRGEEKEGLKYVLPLIACSIIVFFLVRVILGSYFSDFLGG